MRTDCFPIGCLLPKEKLWPCQCLALCFTTGNFLAAHQIVLHAGAMMYGVLHALSWAKLLGPFAAYGG